jgi:DNA-binding beta-propeller fold protein YncE
VAGGLYDIGEMTDTSHGVTTSPDGKWVYFGSQFTLNDVPQRIVMIVNARTLKLDKVLLYPGSSFVHHMMGFTDSLGNDRVVITVNRCPQFFLDPNDNNRVARTITTEDAPLCGHTYPTVDPTGRYFYQSADGSYYGGEDIPAGVTKIDLETFERTGNGGTGYMGSTIWGLGHGGRVIGMAHTADGKITYAVDAHNSYIFKIDNETGEVLGHTSAGVAGPYGACLNWDETLLYVIGKGEGSHNKGNVVGIIDTVAFRPYRDRQQMPISLGGSASSIDHCVVHPDPEVNELWITNMNGWEVIVLDMNTNEAEAYIASPNGGDPHGGAFVQYDAEWNATLLADMGGPHTAEIWALRLELATAAAAAAANG